MIEKVFYSIVIVLTLFVTGGLLLPRTAHVERSIEIERPAATVFAVLNGFESFASWSPMLVRDPDVALVLSGPSSGVGARLEWEGDPRLVGRGWQEIVVSEPVSRVSMRMAVDQLGAAESSYLVDRIGGGTRLTWTFDTDLVEGQGIFGGLLARYFGLFFDKWIGSDFEQGLDRLKLFLESLPETDFSGLDAAVVEVEAMDILYVTSSAGDGDLAQGLANAFREISAFMSEQGLEMAAQPMAITRAWDERGFRFEAAIPIDRNDVKTSGRVTLGRSPSGQAVRVVHRGPYETMPVSYERLAAYMAVHGLREGRVSWEHYISDPGETAPEDVITHIYFLIDNAPQTGKDNHEQP